MECPNCGHRIGAHSRRCGSCGRIIPPAQHLLEESGVVEEPAAVMTFSSVSGPACRPATLGDRMIATLLDGLVLLGLSAVASAWSFRRWGIAGGAEFHLTAASLFTAGFFSATIVFAYLWLLEAGCAATLGKVLVGIRVVQTGTRSPLASSAIRNVLRVIDGIGFYLLGALIASCSRVRRRLGDVLGGTVVVEEDFTFGTKLLVLVLWTAVLAGSVWALPRVCAGPVSTQPPRILGRKVVHVGYTGDAAYVRVSRFRIGAQLDPVAAPKTVVSADSSVR